MYSADDSNPICLARTEMNRFPVADSLTVTSSVRFSLMAQPKKIPSKPMKARRVAKYRQMTGGGRHGSCCVLRCAAQICKINVCAQRFGFDDSARFAVYRNRQLFRTRLVSVGDVGYVLPRGFATGGKFIAVAHRHSHEVSF